MTSPAILTGLEDRWVVNTRHVIVSGLRASQHALRVDLESGLSIDVAGTWRATAGSPFTGEELTAVDLERAIGSEILSLVLFVTGSIRIVLSTGIAVVAKADASTRVTAQLRGVFTWEADGRSVALRLAKADGDA